ncbi:MAG TPA: sterol desaturase family protein [Phenylobacterium sp.]|nr:sterol desaturase family protein [Phenylobacterium sp.]
MLRALFPRDLFRSASCRADLYFLALNTFVFPAALAWGIVSSQLVGNWANGALAGVLGARPPTAWAPVAVQSIATVCLFLAYELAYWCDHALSHRVPFLWEFHKVHHTAERLSPLTNARVHPVDSLVFANFVAVYTGLTTGFLAFLFGQGAKGFTIGGANAIGIAFLFAIVHLQHSHFWIAFTGPLGRVFLSPAHHQIHHSDDPVHFNKNFGSCLSVWDWMFGTLHMPAKERETLVFGAGPRLRSNHSVPWALLSPFAHGLRELRGPALPRLQRARAPSDP